MRLLFRRELMVEVRRFSGYLSLRSLEVYVAHNREAVKRKARAREGHHMFYLVGRKRRTLGLHLVSQVERRKISELEGLRNMRSTMVMTSVVANRHATPVTAPVSPSEH